MRYAIEGDIAKQVGANAALVYNHVLYWIERNKKAKRAEHRGEVWMYDTHASIASHFGFLTRDQVRRCLDKLVKSGLLKCTTVGFDRTTWYTTTAADNYLANGVEKAVSTKWQKRHMEAAELPLTSGRIATSTIYKEYTKTIGAKAPKRPSIEELTKAFQEKGHPTPKDIAETFIDHYESNGWKVGRNTMKSWRHAVGTWMKREKKTNYARPTKGFNGQNFTTDAAVDFVNNG